MIRDNRTALVIGVGGQDGRLLKVSLERKGYVVAGIGRDYLLSGMYRQPFSIARLDHVAQLLRNMQFDEIYYLAAHHGSSESAGVNDHPESYAPFHQVHVDGFLNLLWSVQAHSASSRVFYAASSLIFDGSIGPRQNEETPFSPVGYYGLTKLQGLYLCRHFRQKYGVNVSTGILYSHESVLRKASFLSKKLITAAYGISKGKLNQVTVGNLQAQNDWGYAPDYVEAFQSIALLERPDDFIVATGEAHSVEEFAQAVFNCFGLNAREHLVEDPFILNRVSPCKIGDASKLHCAVGWNPQQSFTIMVEKLVDDYLRMISEIID